MKYLHNILIREHFINNEKKSMNVIQRKLFSESLSFFFALAMNHYKLTFVYVLCFYAAFRIKLCSLQV